MFLLPASGQNAVPVLRIHAPVPLSGDIGGQPDCIWFFDVGSVKVSP